MFLANMLDEGITILPTHRLLRTVPEDMNLLLSEYFEIEPVKNDFDIRANLSGEKTSLAFTKRDSDYGISSNTRGDYRKFIPP